MKKSVVAILVIVVVIIAGFFLWSNSADAPENSTDMMDDDSTMQEVGDVHDDDSMMDDDAMDDSSMMEGGASVTTVSYTDDGFVPKEITINKGETVMFVNDSSHGMWVASAVHPTHSLYPEKSAGACLGSDFDECENDPPGTSWAFTFDQVGTWGYHNHSRASDTGKVIVK